MFLSKEIGTEREIQRRKRMDKVTVVKERLRWIIKDKEGRRRVERGG
jgi:hypothetical protein